MNKEQARIDKELREIRARLHRLEGNHPDQNRYFKRAEYTNGFFTEYCGICGKPFDIVEEKEKLEREMDKVEKKGFVKCMEEKIKKVEKETKDKKRTHRRKIIKKTAEALMWMGIGVIIYSVIKLWIG